MYRPEWIFVTLKKFVIDFTYAVVKSQSDFYDREKKSKFKFNEFKLAWYDFEKITN